LKNCIRSRTSKDNESKGNEKMEIQQPPVTLDILVALQFAVSIAENSPECFIVSLIYQEMRAV
jgi:hypothetical protein